MLMCTNPVSTLLDPYPRCRSRSLTGSWLMSLPTVLVLYCNLLTVVKYQEFLSPPIRWRDRHGASSAGDSLADISYERDPLAEKLATAGEYCVRKRTWPGAAMDLPSSESYGMEVDIMLRSTELLQPRQAVHENAALGKREGARIRALDRLDEDTKYGVVDKTILWVDMILPDVQTKGLHKIQHHIVHAKEAQIDLERCKKPVDYVAPRGNIVICVALDKRCVSPVVQ